MNTAKERAANVKREERDREAELVAAADRGARDFYKVSGYGRLLAIAAGAAALALFAQWKLRHQDYLFGSLAVFAAIFVLSMVGSAMPFGVRKRARNEAKSVRRSAVRMLRKHRSRIPDAAAAEVERGIKGVDEALNEGVLAGYPVVDVKATLTDGSYHEVDSNENAFKMAAIFAFKDGMRAGQPTLLEPIMAVEVETPLDFVGNVIGDLSARRGVLHGQEEVAGSMVIKAEVPLGEMFGYSTTMRSLSQGRATYTMEFKHYAEAPKSVAEAVISAKTK